MFNISFVILYSCIVSPWCCSDVGVGRSMVTQLRQYKTWICALSWEDMCQHTSHLLNLKYQRSSWNAYMCWFGLGLKIRPRSILNTFLCGWRVSLKCKKMPQHVFLPVGNVNMISGHSCCRVFHSACLISDLVLIWGRVKNCVVVDKECVS